MWLQERVKSVKIQRQNNVWSITEGSWTDHDKRFADPALAYKMIKVYPSFLYIYI